MSPLDQPLAYLREGMNGIRFKAYYDHGVKVIERDDGKLLTISRADWERGEWDVYMKILNFLVGKLVDDSRLLIASSSVDVAARIIEINAELDIIRGITVTPPGYIINTDHTKALHAELKRLVEKL